MQFEDRCMQFEDCCMQFEDRCMQFKDGYVRDTKPCSGFGCLSQASNAAIICASGLGRIRKVHPPCARGMQHLASRRAHKDLLALWLHRFGNANAEKAQKPLVEPRGIEPLTS
jgi:hypothetical protein